MSRAERLLELIQNLRGRRYAAPGRVLAGELGISVRTLYRDIGILKTQGVPIDGDPGVGYLLGSGFTLPPLMFSPDEIEALVLGARWVVDRADGELGRAARNALVKIGVVLPPTLKEELGSSSLLVPAEARAPVDDAVVKDLRRAIRQGCKVEITYRDLSEVVTHRVIWPFSLAYYHDALVAAAWCESRNDFRHFRADRVESWALKDAYPLPRAELVTQWRLKFGIRPDWTADTF